MLTKFVLVIGLCVSSLAFADSSFPGDCTGGNTSSALSMMSSALKHDLAVWSAKRGIALDESTLKLQMDVGATDDDNNSKIIYLLYRLLDGSVSATDHTNFDLYFDGGQEEFANYVEVATNSGYDKEGNPIHGHCTLKIRPVVGNYLPYNTKFEIRNHSSGRVLATFALPASFRLY